MKLIFFPSRAGRAEAIIELPYGDKTRRNRREIKKKNPLTGVLCIRSLKLLERAQKPTTVSPGGYGGWCFKIFHCFHRSKPLSGFAKVVLPCITRVWFILDLSYTSINKEERASFSVCMFWGGALNPLQPSLATRNSELLYRVDWLTHRRVRR